MGHSVGDAAKRSTEKGMAKKAEKAWTPLEVIAEIRRCREAKIFINRIDFIDTLLAEYDALNEKDYPGQVDLLHERISQLMRSEDDLKCQIQILQEKNEEFRRVYEAENRSQSVKVERGAEDNPAVVVSVASNGPLADFERTSAIAAGACEAIGDATGEPYEPR